MKPFTQFVNESKLLASSPTLEGITKVISDYFFGSTITLDKVSDRPEVHSVSNKRGVLPDYRVVKKGKRYRFEEV